MSEERKTCIKMFTISEYEEEEQWLRGMARSGWMLKSTIVPCFYFFERCEPQDIVFKLEFRSQSLGEDQEYFRMLEDFGWKYLLSCNRFRYFYKTAEADERSNELFSDNASKLAMVKKILISRMLPIAIIFLCCVLPYRAGVCGRPDGRHGYFLGGDAGDLCQTVWKDFSGILSSDEEVQGRLRVRAALEKN